jgi:hypothetical protein
VRRGGNSLNGEREKTGFPIVVCQTCQMMSHFFGGNKYFKFLLQLNNLLLLLHLAEQGKKTTTKAHDQRRLLGTRIANPIQFQSALGMRPGALSLLPLPASLWLTRRSSWSS